MRRVSVHAAFAVLALACVALAGYDAARLANAVHVNHEVAALSAHSTVPVHRMANVSATAPPAAADSGGERAPDDDAPRPVQLAHAIALSAAGHYTAAGRRFEALVEESGPLDEIGRAALYDLGNMYLREGAGETASAVRSLPMIEQAKARYRALLRVAPDDWDARYNLERALRLAPETQEAMDASEVATKHGVKLRGAQSEDLP
jgi:mxaK protein